jgi:transcriptional regulator of NAD metabolism
MSTPTPSEDRRSRLVELLRSSEAPITGSDLAAGLGVSRQVIVNDVAIVRASGVPILGSPRGYVLVEGADDRPIATISCRHDREGNRREFEILVDRGIEVVDVVVEHPVYGELTANLLVRTRSDVDGYIEAISNDGVQPLWALTDGVHVHHVRAPSDDALDAAKRELAEAGILLADD